jgi:hypothetical protein
MQIAPMKIQILAGDFGRLFIGQCFDSLHGFEMPFYPVPLAPVVPQAVGMAGVPVHVAQGGGNAAVGKKRGHLMQRFRGQAPEIPLHGVVAQAGGGIPYLRMDEIGQL